MRGHNRGFMYFKMATTLLLRSCRWLAYESPLKFIVCPIAKSFAKVRAQDANPALMLMSGKALVLLSVVQSVQDGI